MTSLSTHSSHGYGPNPPLKGAPVDRSSAWAVSADFETQRWESEGGAIPTLVSKSTVSHTRRSAPPLMETPLPRTTTHVKCQTSKTRQVVMQMDIHAHSFKLTSAIEKYAARRVEHAIGRATRSIQGIMVRLLHVNGERGGVDKTCRMVVWLRRGEPVIAEATDRDLYAAIDAASVKLRVALGRRLSRRRTLPREHTNRRLRH